MIDLSLAVLEDEMLNETIELVEKNLSIKHKNGRKCIVILPIKREPVKNNRCCCTLHDIFSVNSSRKLPYFFPELVIIPE